jgi:hypothetical protein
MLQDMSGAQSLPALEPVARTACLARTRRADGLTWRHGVTGLLLIVALPIFALAALASLPVLVIFAGAEALRKMQAHRPDPHHRASLR